ncbi:MAG TPA: hypothetical protein VF338_09470, partial [Leptolinea sp.]
MTKLEIKKLAFLFTLSIFLLITSGSCRKSFLDVQPSGALSEFNLATNEGINALLIGAYSMLDGVSSVAGGWETASSN